MWNWMGSYGGYGMSGFGPWGSVGTLLFWGAVIVLILGLARWLLGTLPPRAHHTHPASHRALDILEERYARGEIDRDEYLQRRDDLR